MKTIITSESVNIGHPDKTCDVIADAFLDAAIKKDPNARMAVECAIKDNYLFIYGEATTTAKVDYKKIAREVLRDIGYGCKFKIIEKISRQSPEINKAVVRDELTAGDIRASAFHIKDNLLEASPLAAGDQGIVYGYATNETPEFMPMSILMAHKIMRRFQKWRESTPAGDKFHADAKSQVSIEYDNNKPIAIHTILVSVSHSECLSNQEICEAIKKHVVDVVLADSAFAKLETKNLKLIINPSGAFTIWGSHSDSGCVGRKIVVDTYGGVGRVGGGCFSSKDPTKVDRSGAYYARWVAKNIVANKMADKVEVSASYAIGLSDPIKVNIECFGSGRRPQAEIEKYVYENFDFRPANIIKELDLLRPIYKDTACYGHFGRDGFPWESIFIKSK